MAVKKRIRTTLAAGLLAILAAGAPAQDIFAEEGTEAPSDAIASSEERAPQQEVGREDMTVVTADDLADGTYEIEVESSSSMFQIVKAELTVSNGEMTAVLTLGGTGYLRLYMGTAEEAVAADASDYAEYKEDEDGAYTYEVAVSALDEELDCASFSKRKEKWYDHTILFDAYTLPKEALLVELSEDGAKKESSGSGTLVVVTDGADTPETEDTPDDTGAVMPIGETETSAAAQAAYTELADGIYTVEVSLSGGSGKASVTSPAKLAVKDHAATVSLAWSSPNYDYMKLLGTTYEPVSEAGENSVFELPVTAFDTEVEVIADTTAMSVPHEITYTIVLDSATIRKEGGSAGKTAVAVVLFAVAASAGIFLRKQKKK